MSTSGTDLNIIKFSPKTNLNTNPQLPEINKLTDENINEILNFINSSLFPVGTMLFNDNPNFDPNVEYGGTWELIKGRMLIGFDDTDEDFNELGKNGGSKSHIQTLEELAPHVHGIQANTNQNAVSGAGRWPWVNYDGVNRYTESAGEGEPMDIMNPYYVANIWHRVA